MERCKECGDTCTCKLAPVNAKKVSKEALANIVKAKTVLVESKQTIQK